MPQLSLRASFEPSTVDVDKRTVQLTWTTGARVLRGWWDRYWEELSLDPKHVRMERLQSGAAPLLNTHSQYDLRDVIGVVENAKLEKGKGTATVRFDSGPEGEDAFRKVREGILRNISVGYATYRMEKLEDGDTTIPVYRAVDWEPHEISLVPIGADAGAVTRSGGGMTNPCVFIEERDMPDPDKTPTPAPATPAPASQPAAADQRSVAELERERILGIQRVGRSLKRPDTEVAQAITAGTSLADYRAAAQDAYAEAETIQVEKRSTAIVAAGEDSRDKWLRGATAWILQRSAVGTIVADHAKTRGEKVDLDPGEFRGLRLVDLARQSLERAGVRTAGMTAMEIAGAAFEQRSSGGMATTGDFTVLLETALHKVLLAKYGTTPDTWRRYCRVGSVTDFRSSPRYRQGTFGKLDSLNEAGEFVNKSIPDGEKQALKAGTKGNIIAISRQTIVNDDMGAFSSLAVDLGRAAALTIEIDVFALLALNGGLGPVMNDGKTLFHADHGNITAGAALSVNALDADRIAMASQKDPSNNEILDLRPAILLLPIGLGGEARVINDAQYDPDTANKLQRPNKVRGLFRDIVDTPRMAGTRRYVFADPGDAATIEVAFLEGQQQPYMEMKSGYRVDGVQWKVRHDYGVAGVDYRGAVTNAGA